MGSRCTFFAAALFLGILVCNGEVSRPPVPEGSGNAAAPGAAASGSGPARGLTNELRQWVGKVASNAAMSAKLAAHVFPGMDTGFIATADVKENETLMEIPFSMMMTPKDATESEIGDYLGNLSTDEVIFMMALFLLHQKATVGSKFHAYARSLPPTAHLPLSWSAGDLETLNGTRLLAHVQQQKELLARNYERIVTPLLADKSRGLSPDDFSLPQLTWALQMVLSRSLTVTYPDGIQLPVMVPVADLFNYAGEGGKIIIDSGASMIKVVAQVPVKAGQQVFTQVDLKSNFDLLALFGFTLPDNQHDTIEMVVQPPRNDPFEAIREGMRRALGLPADHTYTLTRGGSLQGIMLALRVQFLRPSEFDKFAVLEQGKPVSLENELAVMRAILATCKSTLAQFPTTREQDTAALLAEGGLPRNHAFAIIYRMGEKRVLEEAMERIAAAWHAILMHHHLE
eukprot:jgi/Mesvir1/14171/Mv09634-RA.1